MRITLCSISLRFGRRVGGDEDRVRCNRPPECLRLQRRNLQRLLQRDAVQFHANAPRGVVRIEQHVDAGQLSDGLVDGLGIFAQLQRDRSIGDGSQFDRSAGFLHALVQGRLRRLARGRLTWLFSLLQRAADFIGFLLRDETGGIDGDGLLELGQGFLQLAALLQQLAFVDVRGRRRKTGLAQTRRDR